MNSSDFTNFLWAALGFAVLCLSIIFVPLFLVASVPIVAYLLYRNSPKVKEREARERTEALYRQALALAPPDVDEHLERLRRALQGPALSAAIEIYRMEGVEPPPPVPPVSDSIDGARYRDQLIRYINTAHDHRRTDGFVDALIDCLLEYSGDDGAGIFTADVRLDNREIERLIVPFYDHKDHFAALKRQLDRNLNAQKGVLPSDHKGDNCAFAYLNNTPLLPLEKRRFRVGLDARFEHTQIVAGSGSGKTSLIEYIIHHDLEPENDCCVIVIDSQRQLIERLARRALWLDEVAYFSPHHKLGINLFDMKAQGEEEVIAVVDLLEYVLSSLMDAELTTKQATLFNYAVHLLMTVPGANLASLRRLLRMNARTGLGEFIPYLEKLPETARDFFENEFGQQGYASTKDEIMWRVDAMQRNPAFARIFGATRNPIDMFEEMAERKLILVDTDVNHLGDKGSSFFGRFFIALILKASRQRFTGKHRPVYLYIDECAAYLDSRLELMLQQARKANIGVILAHQDLEQARKAGVLTTVLGNTATKFAGRLSDADARVMAANMSTSAEFLKSLPRYHFALSRLGEDTCAVSFDTWTFENADKRTNRDELTAEMERRYGHLPAEAEKEPEPPAQPKVGPRVKVRPGPKPVPEVDEEIRPTNKL